MKDLVGAVTFLTRIPLPVPTQTEPARSVPWFPIVGAGIGALVAAVYAAATEVMPTLLAAVLAVTVGIVVTGALHEDGLADTVDAFGGSHTPERTLQILADPHIGVFGAVAVTLSVVTRITALAALDAWTAAAVVPAAHALSRAAAVTLLSVTPPAKTTGLGHGTRPSAGRGLATVAVAAAIAGVLLGVWAVPAALLAAFSVWLFRRWSLRRIGGSTGDVAGATEQLTEILVVAAAAALVTSQANPVWWTP